MNRSALFAPLLVGILAGPVSGQVVVPSPKPSPASPGPWAALVTVTSAADTNINHDEAAASAYGGVLGGTLRYGNPSRSPWQAEYQVGLHRYSSSGRWDRLSHRFWGSREWDLHGPWKGELIAEVSLKGTTEDRELSNQYVLLQRVRYRLDDRRRLRFYGGTRLKRYEEDRERNATNVYLGSELNYRGEQGDLWDLGARYELNQASAPRHQYGRWTFYFEYETPLGQRNRLGLELKYRQKLYRHRTVEVDNEDIPRRDMQWIPSIAWFRSLTPRLDLRLGYDFETRSSNDPEKDFSAHLLTLSLTRRW